MALIVPLQIFERIYWYCGRTYDPSTSGPSSERLARLIIQNASLFDTIRWRRVSGAFKRAADKRIGSFTRIDVRVYDGLADLRNHSCEKDQFEWHPHGNVMLMETGGGQLGIAVDNKMKFSDIQALLQVLNAFRHTVEELFLDSPIIELLVSQINRQQVNLLIEKLKIKNAAKQCFNFSPSKNKGKQIAMLPEVWCHLPGPFFPVLKKLTITSQSNQLEHLSRLLTYGVGVDFLYETQNIDLLCLKIILGGQWCRKRNTRMFRHVHCFREWTAADSLGERYFQQFSGQNKRYNVSR